tara:strand:- start:118 stop:561 length:444 start_codon:yes stop_codon:yes gene_type:complete
VSSNSWDSFYIDHEDVLLLRHRLNIYLRESRDVVSLLNELGYKEACFSEDHPVFEQFLECGQYCFTSTFEGEDDEEQEVPVIEIQHQPPRKYISRLSTGLCFMYNSTESNIAEFVADSFGFLPGMVHSVCMFEGDGHYSEAKGFKQD